MMQRARPSPARRFVVATETGVLHRLRRENPDKQFHALAESAECRFMKLITLEKLRDCLRDLKPEGVDPPDVAARARRAMDRMLALGWRLGARGGAARARRGPAGPRRHHPAAWRRA